MSAAVCIVVDENTLGETLSWPSMENTFRRVLLARAVRLEPVMSCRLDGAAKCLDEGQSGKLSGSSSISMSSSYEL